MGTVKLNKYTSEGTDVRLGMGHCFVKLKSQVRWVLGYGSLFCEAEQAG